MGRTIFAREGDTIHVGKEEAGCGGTILLILLIVLFANLCEDDDKKPSEDKQENATGDEQGSTKSGVTIDTRDGKGVFLRSSPTDSSRTKNGIWEGARVKPTGNSSSDSSGTVWVEIEVPGQAGKKGWVKRDWLSGYE